jgi:LacI family transcriptional regulator
VGLVAGAPERGAASQRLAGWEDALRAAGVDGRGLARLGVTGSGAQAAAASLLDGPAAATVLLTASRELTAGVLRAAAAAAAEVLVFGRLELAGLLPVPVWTVEHDPRELGRRGAELLLDRLDGNAGPARRVIVPTALVPPSGGLSRRP